MCVPAPFHHDLLDHLSRDAHDVPDGLGIHVGVVGHHQLSAVVPLPPVTPIIEGPAVVGGVGPVVKDLRTIRIGESGVRELFKGRLDRA